MKHNWTSPCVEGRRELEAKDGEKRYCESYGCMWCDGGLEACSVCGSFEGATTTDCPGAEMHHFTRDKVYTTELDFVNGNWCRNPRKDGMTAHFREIDKHYQMGERGWPVEALYYGWLGLPSMEKEKMSRGW